MWTRRRAYLLRALQSDDLPARKRVQAAYLLAALGDPRFQADAWWLPNNPLLGFVRIPGGAFWMGGGEPDDDESDAAHQCTLPDYYIGRWPVTIAQFSVFKGIEHTQPHHPIPSRRLAGMHDPVISVTWDDAFNYCQWLDAQFRMRWPHLPEPLRRGVGDLASGGGWRVVLPSDAEWEKAARGVDHRPYPWGYHFDEDCANVGEKTSDSSWFPEERATEDIGEPSPVGCYPRGASPYGVEDLLGNVEEWTRSTNVVYPSDANEVEDSVDEPLDTELHECIVRGGPYDVDCGRVYERHWRRSQPFEDVGFRLAIVRA